MKMVAIFPGQGSQYVGMGKDFYDKFNIVKELFEQASDVVSIDLKKLCFHGPENVLTSTQNVQPAVTLVNIACYEVLKRYNVRFQAFAGHSLGEYSALYAAGVMTFSQVMELTKLRGAYMHEAAEKNPGAMAAIMNYPLDKLKKVCEECGSEVANINSEGQIIITGTVDEVQKTIDTCKKKGVKRCIMLKVSGPWHSKYMKSAQNKLDNVLSQHQFNDPTAPVISNVDADYLGSGKEVRKKLASQVCRPVFWLQSMERLLQDGYDVFVEVGPKKVLSGLMRRINPGARVFQVEDTDSLEVFLDFLRTGS